MPNHVYATIMSLAGIGIPVLAALNAALGQRMGSPAGAAVILFCVALAVAVAAVLLTGPSVLARAVGAPPHLFFAGTLVAFYVLAVTAIAPRFGVGNAVFFVLVGQMISAAIIDQFGLFGAPVKQLSPVRGGGLALMVAGAVLIQRG